MKVNFRGKEIGFNLVRSNLRKEVSGFFPGMPENNITNTLVKYDSDANTVTVDECASDNYAIYAAIHESICCGPYRDLAPETDEPNRRCGLIDKMLIEAMPELEQKLYIRKRIEMFETLIEKKLNPPLETKFKKSLKTLKSLRVSLLEGGDDSGYC